MLPTIAVISRGLMHGAAPGSGIPRYNKNALKHGRYTREAIKERRHLRALGAAIARAYSTDRVIALAFGAAARAGQVLFGSPSLQYRNFRIYYRK